MRLLLIFPWGGWFRLDAVTPIGMLGLELSRRGLVISNPNGRRGKVYGYFGRFSVNFETVTHTL